MNSNSSESIIRVQPKRPSIPSASNRDLQPIPDPKVVGDESTAPQSATDVSVANSLGTLPIEPGMRDLVPTVRNWGSTDNGQKFDFEEKKKEYPKMKEILATGRYFGSASILFLKPHFQGNTALAESVTGVSTPFDFDFEAAPRFQLGFESKFGPGGELNYWQYDESSNPTVFTSDGANVGSTSAWMPGSNQSSRLTASNAGESIAAVHSINIESFEANFFKYVQLPISRVNGKFGFQYVSIHHSLDASLTNAGGTEIGRLDSDSDFRGFGPTFGLEYYRPVGHTQLELLTSVGGSVLFGQQDQYVTNTQSGSLSRMGADQFSSNAEFLTAVQYKKMLAEKRYVFARIGYTYETWLGGGTAILPESDFGLRGFTFSLRFNH